MRDADSWADQATVLDYLSECLRAGNLALVLGAGVSVPFGLPSWDTLLERLGEKCAKGIVIPSNAKAEVKAELLLTKCYGGDAVRFAEATREALYRTAELDLERLRQHALLGALGALVMASSRGGVAKVITFNFDNVLELYLAYHGFVARSIAQAPELTKRCDVSVYHPHGFLAADAKDDPLPPSLVFVQSDYDKVVGDVRNPWHRTVSEVMSTHTCIFIGLSGSDQNVSSLLLSAQEQHASKKLGYPNWAIRFSRPSDDMLDIWSKRGVHNVLVDDYAAVPSLLFRICQLAARK